MLGNIDAQWAEFIKCSHILRKYKEQNNDKVPKNLKKINKMLGDGDGQILHTRIAALINFTKYFVIVTCE